jgi:hypothetical protein
MKTRLLSSLLAVALISPLSASTAAEVAASPAPAAVAAPDPAIEIKHLAALFRAGDLTGLAQGLVPPSQWERARTAFASHRNKPVTDADRAHFAEKLQEITAPDAVDRLMREVEPELAKARPQWAGMLLMACGAMQVAVNSPETKLTDAEREALRSALPGIQRWLGATDFFDTGSMRRALTLLTDAARRTGITDLEQLRTMPLESLLDRAGPVLGAAKEAARIYGVDLDAIADSLRVDVLERGQDTARVRVTVTLFGAPIWAEHDLILKEGHWYGKHAGVHFDEDVAFVD